MFTLVLFIRVQVEMLGKNVKKLSYRESRFQQFSSIEYEGSIYMSPQDFLESLTEETPRSKFYIALFLHKHEQVFVANKCVNIY